MQVVLNHGPGALSLKCGTVFVKKVVPSLHCDICCVHINQSSTKLTDALNKQGEAWHREINNVTKKMKQEIHEMEYKYLTVLNDVEDDITRRISEITKISVDLNKMLDLKDICLIANYKSRNAEYRMLRSNLKVSLLNFWPQKNQRHCHLSTVWFAVGIIYQNSKE